MSTYAIEIDGLTKSYDGNVHALDGVDIKIKEGEFFGLLGPNGAGKTTTITVSYTHLTLPTTLTV